MIKDKEFLYLIDCHIKMLVIVHLISTMIIKNKRHLDLNKAIKCPKKGTTYVKICIVMKSSVTPVQSSVSGPPVAAGHYHFKPFLLNQAKNSDDLIRDVNVMEVS